jgi:hypothetical protein
MKLPWSVSTIASGCFVLSILLSVPSMACGGSSPAVAAGSSASAQGPEDFYLDEDLTDSSLIDLLQKVVRPLHSQLSILALFPQFYTKPKPTVAQVQSIPDTFPPLTVRPPDVTTTPPLPGEVGTETQEVPEPGTLLSGAIGSTMILAAWWRKRRSKSKPADSNQSADEMTV